MMAAMELYGDDGMHMYIMECRALFMEYRALLMRALEVGCMTVLTVCAYSALLSYTYVYNGMLF